MLFPLAPPFNPSSQILRNLIYFRLFTFSRTRGLSKHLVRTDPGHCSTDLHCDRSPYPMPKGRSSLRDSQTEFAESLSQLKMPPRMNGSQRPKSMIFPTGYGRITPDHDQAAFATNFENGWAQDGDQKVSLMDLPQGVELY